MIGPAEAGLSRARDRYRYVLYVKCKDELTVEAVRQETEAVSQEGRWERTCRIQYDRDPMTGY